MIELIQLKLEKVIFSLKKMKWYKGLPPLAPPPLNIYLEQWVYQASKTLLKDDS